MEADGPRANAVEVGENRLVPAAKLSNHKYLFLRMNTCSLNFLALEPFFRPVVAYDSESCLTVGAAFDEIIGTGGAGDELEAGP